VQAETAEAGPSLIPLRERLFGGMRQPLLLLLLSVGLLLLLACANIANLLLARATSRRQEMTVRAALGATRSMLVRQVMTEGFVLAVAGGFAGVVLAAWLLPLMLKIAPDGVRYVHADVGAAVAAVAMAAAIAAGVLAGLFPAIQASRATQQSGLSGGRIAGQAEGRRLRQLLVVAQVALSLVLLVAAGLLLRSFSQIVSVDPGFRAEGLLTFRIDLPTERYRTPQSQAIFYEALLGRLRGVPGVSSVAATTRLPFTTGESTRGIVPEGMPARTSNGALFRVISPDYFSVMGVPLVAGRFLNSQDGAGGAPVAVINETMARKFWPGESAVGRRFRISNEPTSIEIVGVARDMKHVDLREEQGAAYFLPLQQAPWSYMTIVMRTDPASPDVASAVRQAVGEVDKDVPVPALRSMNELMAGSLGLERFQLIVTGAFAVLALALASLGLYGVMSYLVGRRRKEMAVRLALGAQPASLVALIMRDALLLVGIGCVVGGVAGALVARSLQGMLFGVASTDATTFAGSALLLTIVAALASYLPARRATLIDPARALRAD
jgi:putative ABC transport system permease protein